MSARPQTITDSSNRRPPGKATAADTSESSAKRVPAEYNSLGWDPMPNTIRHLYGETKMPSGYAWQLFCRLNTLQLANFNNGKTFLDIPESEWSDGRQHRLATPYRSVPQLAKDLGCSTRTIEVHLSDMVKRGIAAKRKGLKVSQYALLIDRLHEVKPIEDEADEPIEDEADEPIEDEADEPIEDEADEPIEEPLRGRVVAGARVKLPHLPVTLSERSAKKFELSYTVIAGEVRIDVEVLSSSGAKEERKNPAVDCGDPARKSLIPLRDTNVASPFVHFAEKPAGNAESHVTHVASDIAACPLPRPHAQPSNEWRTAVQNVVIRHCKTTAGPRLITAIADACTSQSVSPAEFVSYCDSLIDPKEPTRAEVAAATRARHSLVKYGAALFERWASDLAAIRAHERDNPGEPVSNDAELRYYRRRWSSADAELRAELHAADPDHYPPKDEL